MQKKITSVYSFITGIFISFFAFMTLNISSISFFKRVAIIIFSIVIFDIIFSLFEWIAFKIKVIYDNNKLKRDKLKRARIKEKQKIINEMEERINKKNYDDIKNAKAYIKAIKKLSENSIFNSINEKIVKCINNLVKIIDELEKDTERYIEASFLFEAQLPEFYNNLKCYIAFLGKKDLTEEYYKVLNKYVDKFIESVEKQKFMLDTNPKQNIIRFETLKQDDGNGEN